MNDKKLWFKRRRYGWGWTPVTWQGWLVLLLFIIIIITGALLPTSSSSAHNKLGFLLFVAIAIFGLIRIGIKKGPTPKWRWGKKSTDDSDKDL